ncbi:hypothetical protein [Modicisalibacter sp. 'Wilcox']|uniref:hypothetical protein n=1 Tax=Modicisalibacter sp. 'Wilcox' TaxID=2679914 RepID=UPI0013CFA641|nr:hypothetical protein [Modicisalibacter sp. 'Wilcox']
MLGTIFGVALITSAQASDDLLFIGPDSYSGTIKNVSLYVDDQVDGNCWTNVDSIRQNARLKLEQSNIRVYNEPMAGFYPFNATMIITGVGYRVSGICAGAITVKVTTTVASTSFNKNIFMSLDGDLLNKTLIATSSNNLNQSFSETSDAAVAEFSSNVISGRRNNAVQKLINDNISIYKKEPMTMKELNELVEKSST